MNSDLKKIVSLLKEMSVKDRHLISKSLKAYRADSLGSKIINFVNSNSGIVGKLDGNLMSKLGYHHANKGAMRKFNLRFKDGVFKYFSSEDCHKDLKADDTYTYHRCMVDKLISSARVANEKGHWEISGELLKKALKIAHQTENQEMLIEALRILSRRALTEHAIKKYILYQKEREVEKRKLIILEQATETFNYFLLKIRYNCFEDILPVLSKQLEVFKEMNEILGFQRLRFFILYTEITILQLEKRYHSATHQSFGLLSIVKQNDRRFNKYFFQLSYLKVAECLILNSYRTTTLDIIFKKDLLSNFKFHHTIDLRILCAWNQFHQSSGSEIKELNDRLPFNEEFALFSIGQTNDIISAHEAFTLKKYYRSQKAIDSILGLNRKMTTPWIEAQMRILELMLFIERKKFDLFENKHDSYKKFLGRLNKAEMTNTLVTLNTMLEILKTNGYSFKGQYFDKFPELKSHFSNTSIGLSGLYGTQPAFFMNWLKSKIH